ncbi:MAG: ABC transporter permease [Bacilli bacterium]
MQTILAVLKLRLVQFMREWRTLAIDVGVFFFIIVILGTALRSTFASADPAPNFPVSVYAPSAQLLPLARGALASRQTRGVFTVHFAKSESALQNDVQSGRALVGVTWTGDARRSRAVISLHFGNWLQGQAVANALSAYGTWRRLTGADPSLVKASAGAMVDGGAPTIVPVTAYQYFTFGMVVYYMLVYAPVSAAAMVSQDERALRARCGVAPVSRWTLATGEFLAWVVFIAVFGALIVVGSHFLLGVRVHNTAQILCTLVAYAVGVSGIGMTLAAVIPNPRVLRSIGMLAVNVLAILGGSFSPLSGLPAWIAHALRWLPNHWALRTMLDIVTGASWRSLAPSLAVMLGVGTLLGVIGMARRRGAPSTK